MAKKRSAAIVRNIPVRAPAPVIRVSAPRAPAKTKSRRRSVSSIVGINAKTIVGAGVGGAALGFIEKTFPNLPTVPIVGRAGTIAIAAYFLSRGRGSTSGIMRDIALAGSVIAGYQFGKFGVVAGDVMGDFQGTDDVSGLAAQV